MNHIDPKSKIARLIAVIQTMMPELCWNAPHNAAQGFHNAARDDDPLALAINEILTPEEIAEAFAWPRAALGSADAELAAMPVIPYLSARQQIRVRVMIVANDAADEAFLAATGPGEAPRRDPERVLEIATTRFVETMTQDALAHRADLPGDAPRPTIAAHIDALPEPWRTRTRRELQSLGRRIEKTVEQDRAGSQ